MTQWYLRKHDDDSVHGPVSLEQLQDWSLSAKVSPLDKVSSDEQQTWQRAPMVEELHMDWLVEVSEDYLYGPATTFGAVQEFLAAEEIDGDTFLINTRDHRRSQIRDMPAFRQPASDPSSPGTVTSRLDEGSAQQSNLSDRVLKVEEMLIQQRRALEESELRYQLLRQHYLDKTGETPPG